MIVELRAKSQITIPSHIVRKLALSPGDKMEIHENNGVITIMPVTIYSKQFINDIGEEIAAIKEKIAAGEQPVYDSLDAMFDKLRER